MNVSLDRSCLVLRLAKVSCGFALEANLNIESQHSRSDYVLMFHRFLADTETGVSKTMLVGIVFGEFLLLLFIFDLILYITKKWGFISYIQKSVGKAVSKSG